MAVMVCLDLLHGGIGHMALSQLDGLPALTFSTVPNDPLALAYNTPDWAYGDALGKRRGYIPLNSRCHSKGVLTLFSRLRCPLKNRQARRD